ncbi:peptidyl-prolyl cis-trans isomerase SurA [Larkinella arboricola]|uniref:Peptidyl-prolyl cis-trans isomerase SurA n=1 Tax=Larkinella arboricola TaxID=643671 RepID=A0A327X0M6_LARAB|nr:peptidylprolyl isomerase [Larkinella arboricola]RAK00011.1 peptidyl-prolyl cis-trans isomerase SurA [Larkinella arboricola]
MKSTILSSFALTVLLALVTSTGFSQGKGVSLNKIIAKIDNYYVLKSDLEQTRQSYAQQNQKAPADCQLLESLVVQKVLLAKAEIDSVMVDDKIIDNQMDSRMSYMIQQFGSEKNIVEAYGKSIESLKSELRAEVKEQMLGQRMQTKITDDVKVSPNEVRKFFNSIPRDSLPYIPAEVEIGHIVRLAKVTKEQREDLRKRLLALKERVVKGEEFAKLATEFSEDVGSAQKGGDLGFAKRGQMVPEFEGAALKLKPNEMSEIVESEFGLHLIQLIEVRGAEYHARHILLRPDYNRLDLTEPRRFLDSLRTLIQADSIKFEKAAKDFSEDKATADAGGIIRDPQTNSSLQPLDQTMDYTLFMTLDTMKVGTISPPMDYRLEDGKTAVRLLYFKRKVPPHTASLKDDYEKIANIVMVNKKNKAIDEWFKKAVSDVYINVDPEYESCQIFGSVKTEGP